MKTNLPLIITTVAEAKAFLTELHSNGEAYHFEDDHTQLVGDPFTLSEGLHLNSLMGNIYDIGFDASEYLNELEKLIKEINKLRDRYDNTVDRRVYNIGKKLRNKQNDLRELTDGYYSNTNPLPSNN